MNESFGELRTERLIMRRWRDADREPFATEAAGAALDVASNGVGLPRVWSITAVLNVPASPEKAL